MSEKEDSGMKRIALIITAAAATLSGCTERKPESTCIGGIEYISTYRGGVTHAVDIDSNPVPCEEGE